MSENRWKSAPTVLRDWFFATVFLIVFAEGAEAQQRFACDTLVVSGNPEYPPLLWQSSQVPGQLVGAVPELLQEIAAPLGLRVEVRNIGSWARVQRQAAQGEIDLVAGAFRTPERQAYLDYVLPPMISLETSVWVPRSREFTYQGWPSLRNKKGCTLINNSFGALFDQYALEFLNIDGVRSIEQSFRMAKAGRVDYVLYEQLQGQVKLARLGLDDEFVALGPVVSREGLFFAFPKRSPCNNGVMREAFASRLAKLVDNGRVLELVSEYGQKYRVGSL